MAEGNAGGASGGDGGSSSKARPSKARKPKSQGKAGTPPASDQPPTVSQSAPTPTDMLGQVAWLMVQSGSHKHLFLADLEWLTMPAVILKQFRVWRQGPQPIAYASWALLTEEAEQRLLSGQRRLGPGEWNAGDRLWLIDVVAPDAVLPTVLATLQRECSRGQRSRPCCARRGIPRAGSNGQPR